MFKKVMMIAAAMVLSGIALASDKVAVFDLQTAILSTEVAKQRVQELQSNAEFAAMQAKFESLRVDLQGLAKDAETNGMTWSQEQQAEHRKKIEYKRADLELAAKKLQAEKNAAVKRIMQELAPKAKTVLNQMITAEGIGLVLDSKVAYYADASFDITAKVTDKLNKAK